MTAIADVTEYEMLSAESVPLLIEKVSKQIPLGWIPFEPVKINYALEQEPIDVDTPILNFYQKMLRVSTSPSTDASLLQA